MNKAHVEVFNYDNRRILLAKTLQLQGERRARRLLAWVRSKAQGSIRQPCSISESTPPQLKAHVLPCAFDGFFF